jgi:predicted nucleic acid-binding protein
MPTLYVDTSALVKRYVREVGTIWTRRMLARPVHQRIYTALLAQTEVLSALQRKVQAHPLRAYDALHLACALAVRDTLQEYGLPVPLFVTADDTLLAAARSEGFPVDNPLQHP